MSVFCACCVGSDLCDGPIPRPGVCVSLSAISATITRYTYSVWVERVQLRKNERKTELLYITLMSLFEL
jgi:hypothetical protein